MKSSKCVETQREGTLPPCDLQGVPSGQLEAGSPHRASSFTAPDRPSGTLALPIFSQRFYGSA